MLTINPQQLAGAEDVEDRGVVADRPRWMQMVMCVQHRPSLAIASREDFTRTCSTDSASGRVSCGRGKARRLRVAPSQQLGHQLHQPKIRSKI